MFSASTNRAAAYSKVGVETGVSAATPHRLILMLFDGAMMSINTAIVALERKDVPAKGAALSRAIEIIANGLDASLDHEAGGELSLRLSSLYEYMTERLLHANLHNDRKTLEEVLGLLGGLRESWQAIESEVSEH